MAVRQRSLLAAGNPALDPSARVDRIDLGQGAWIEVGRDWLRGADTLLDLLIEKVEWHQDRRRMYERMVDDPRLTHWYQRGASVPHPVLTEIGAALEDRFGVPLGGPALNYYRNGRDSVAFHRDRELRDLDNGLVAIITLSARRPFLIRPHGGGHSRNLSPGSGDLLVMGGRTQRGWEHGVPKVASSGPRISTTWRWPIDLNREGVTPRRST